VTGSGRDLVPCQNSKVGYVDADFCQISLASCYNLLNKKSKILRGLTDVKLLNFNIGNFMASCLIS